MLLSACSPPFNIFNIGIGKVCCGFSPVISLYKSEKCSWRLIPFKDAATRETAIDIAKIELAPNCDLSFVPSRSIKLWSIFSCWMGSFPTINGPRMLLMLLTAFRTPFPWYLISLSLNSRASFDPVEAPLGTIAIPSMPLSRITLHEMVGVPRESNIWIAFTWTILDISGNI